MSRINRWWLLLLVPVLLGGGFVVWAQSTASPMPEAQLAMEASSDTDGVLVTTGSRLTFRPLTKEPSAGLIFYPGARVRPEAYAPAARNMAAEGYLVVIVPMPLHLALFAPDRAASVISSHPEVKDWAVGGHSLGGTMAARFAHRNPTAVTGLVHWASYPANTDDLSQRDLAVTSIYGSRDGLATPDKINASRPLLPPDTAWVMVEGGNHAQFGWYGPQRGDEEPTISRHAQQREVTAAMLAFLERIAR